MTSGTLPHVATSEDHGVADCSLQGTVAHILVLVIFILDVLPRLDGRYKKRSARHGDVVG